ncbi:hypothetical protein QQZ08_010678 [Neonectria magnoliae]|uniref:Peptidase C1A papain C-terminal domain-containing protein n=1 Tax=Neonectria magnoliae TaxID=2732573 RepID=A0ABR1HF77_9HYPO
MASTNWGYIPNDFNPKDPMYVYGGQLKDKDDMRSANLLKDFPEAFKNDADATGSCVIDAVSAALGCLSHLSKDNTIPSQPSRRFIYYNARAIPMMASSGDGTKWPNTVFDTGLRITEAMEAIAVYGAAPEWQFPWVVQDFSWAADAVWGVNERGPDAAYVEAAKTSAIEYYRLDFDRGEAIAVMEWDEVRAVGTATMSRVRQCLSEGLPVIFAFHFFWETFKTVGPAAVGDDGYPTIEKIPAERRLVGPSNKKHRTHVALIIGFDQNKRRVLVKSMWDSVPYFWMSYEWIMDVRGTENFWMMRNSGKQASRRTMQTATDSDFLIKHMDRFSDSENMSTAPNSTIATVSRKDGILDLFWITESGTLERGYFYQGWNAWRRTRIPIPVPAAAGAVAAVAATPDRLDVFWMSQDGVVHNAACNPDINAEPVTWEFSTVCDKGKAEPRAGLTTAARGPGEEGYVQVYWVGPDASVRSAGRHPGKPWWSNTVAGPGSAHPYSNIAAIIDGPRGGFEITEDPREAVWWISPEGVLRGIERGTYQMWWKDFSGTTGQPNTVSLTSRIAAIKLKSDAARDRHEYARVYCVSPQGAVRHLVYTYQTSEVSVGIGLGREDSYNPEGNSAWTGTDIKVFNVGDGTVDKVLAFWHNIHGQLMAVNEAGTVTTLSGHRGVRRGSPLGVTQYDGNFLLGMKIYSGVLGMGQYHYP